MDKKKLVGVVVALVLAALAAWQGPEVVKMVRDTVSSSESSEVAPVDTQSEAVPVETGE
jgi:hypothetical protein